MARHARGADRSAFVRLLQERRARAKLERCSVDDRTRFGIWTLVGAIGWIVGLILAFIAIWYLWTDWFPKSA